MKYFLLFSFINIIGFSFGQKVLPFVDFNNYFKSFENSNFRILEFQPIKEFQAGDDLVAYIDTRGNLRIYDGVERKDISNLVLTYHVSDHLMGYNIGPTLNMWDQGKLQTLTYFARDYSVKDSIIVFEDTRFNSVNVYWNKKTFPLYTLTGDLNMPFSIGDNILVFKDNGNYFKIFWRGNIYDLGIWNGMIELSVGCDILVFNDPVSRTMAVFENGEFTDVEQQFVRKFQAGRGFIGYEDPLGNLVVYKNGKKETLSNFSPNSWEVRDDLVVWSENNYFYALQNNKKIQVANFVPKDYLIKNNTLVYRNVLGGVSALVDGKVVDITNQPNATYSIHGNTVLVGLFNKSYIVYKEGKVYNN